MIHHLKGTLIVLEEATITLDIAGIGFTMAVPRSELYTIAQPVHVLTYLHWNQETGPQLFGFSSATERQVFILIISCSGIGPKIALSILQQCTPHDFVTAIALADTKKLSSLKGIGMKKAETLILHLQDKVKKMAITSPELHEDNSALQQIKTITDVLDSLSYTRQEIQHAITHLKQNSAFAACTFDELVRRSLTFLAKNKNAL